MTQIEPGVGAAASQFLGVLCGVTTVPAAVESCGRDGLPIVVTGCGAPPAVAADGVGPVDLALRGHQVRTLVDIGAWRNRIATADAPTAVDAPDTLWQPTLEEWADVTLNRSRARKALTPSRFVRARDFGVLAALRDRIGEIADDSQLLGFVPTHATMLDRVNFVQFARTMAPLSGQRLAFLFADASRRPLGQRERLASLQRLVELHPGAIIFGVDATIAADVIAHGGLAVVGATARSRWPVAPGVGYARREHDAVFCPQLLETRPSTLLADWFADAEPPECDRCADRIDMFDSLDDYDRIIAHNIHATAELIDELLSVAPERRLDWLQFRRRDALELHRNLNSRATRVEVDPTLRYLCELDGPTRRMPTRTVLPRR